MNQGYRDSSRYYDGSLNLPRRKKPAPLYKEIDRNAVMKALRRVSREAEPSYEGWVTISEIARQAWLEAEGPATLSTASRQSSRALPEPFRRRVEKVIYMLVSRGKVEYEWRTGRDGDRVPVYRAVRKSSKL